MDITGRWRKVPAQDDTDWLMLPYGARGLYLQLWRKLDNGGKLALGKHGLRGVCAHVGTLADWPAIEPDLKALLDVGAVLFDAATGMLEIPGFVGAQGAYVVSREAEKKRGQRARGKGQDGDMSTMSGDSAGTNPTEEKREVEEKKSPLTPQTGESARQSESPTSEQTAGWVKVSAAQGKQEQPSEPPPPQGLPGIPAQPQKAPKSNRKRDRDKAAWAEKTLLATTLLNELSLAIQSVRPGARMIRQLDSTRQYIQARLVDGYTAEDVRHVIKVYQAESRHNPVTRNYFDHRTPFRPDQFASALTKTVADASKPHGSGPVGAPRSAQPTPEETARINEARRRADEAQTADAKEAARRRRELVVDEQLEQSRADFMKIAFATMGDGATGMEGGEGT